MIRPDPPLQQGPVPLLIVPEYKSVMAALRDTPSAERGAFIRSRMVALMHWNGWVEANGGLIRGHRLLLSCSVHQPNNGMFNVRDSVFVFDLNDLPSLPLERGESPNSSSPRRLPSLVPTVAYRGPPYPADEVETRTRYGYQTPVHIDMDSSAIYLLMRKPLPTPRTGLFTGADHSCTSA